jgi:hypothetical protein
VLYIPTPPGRPTAAAATAAAAAATAATAAATAAAATAAATAAAAAAASMAASPPQSPLSYLPRVEQEHISQWDSRRNACCGYLSKKAGKSSSLSKGKWQKRWFVLKIQLTGHENYSLVSRNTECGSNAPVCGNTPVCHAA